MRACIFAICLLCLSALGGEPAPAIALPDGPSNAAWQAYCRNDFPASADAFKKTLDASDSEHPDGAYLGALEGLRAACIAQGHFREAQLVNLRMVKAGARIKTAERAMNGLFVLRAVESLPFVESRAELFAAFESALQSADPAMAVVLRDQLSQLEARAGHYESARKLLENNGYVGEWIFAAGPFGTKDRHNSIEKRFAPERALTSLEFTDDDGKPVKVIRHPLNYDPDLNLEAMFPGGRGIFYAMANLFAAEEGDVILSVIAQPLNRIFLRGLPVAPEPDDEPFHRNGGNLYRVHLIKGDNPLLIKMGFAGPLAIRVTDDDGGPARVKTQDLDAAALARHSVSLVRGFVYSEKLPGLSARYFLSRFEKHSAGSASLRDIAQSAALTLPDAFWLSQTLLRENDDEAREILARRMSASFKDSVGVADVAAHMLSAAGAGLGNSEAREVEEARRIREAALKLVPDSHQNLLELAAFFKSHEMPDQAFELLQRCAEAHPDSSLAQLELGRELERRGFAVEAGRRFDRAAQLDSAALPVLANYESIHGSGTHLRELRAKEQKLGMLDTFAQYSDALYTEKFADAGELLQQQEKWLPDRQDESARQRIQFLQEQGKLEEAYTLSKHLFEERGEKNKDHDSVWALVDLALRLDKSTEAKAQMKTFLAAHPNDYEMRRRLHDLESSSEDPWWKEWDVNVADIDTSHFTAAQYPSANHGWIVDFMVTRILPDLSRESYVHIAQKVLNLQGISELSEVLVRAQKENIVFIRTLNPDGSVYMPQNVHSFNLSETASLYKVGPGSILEHAYLEHLDADENEPRFQMGFNFNAMDAPRAVSRWVVLIADEAKDKLKIKRTRPEWIEEQVIAGPKGYSVYQWTNRRVEGIHSERFMPSEADREVIPFVQIETPPPSIHAENFMVRRLRNRVPAEALEKGRRLAARARELHPGKNAEGDAEAFESIVNWVRDAIESDAESRTLFDVWSLKRGTAAQATVLACEMARGAGLNVFTAWVNGSYQPGAVWHPKDSDPYWQPQTLAAFGTGGQVLLYEPDIGFDRWAHFPNGQRAKFFSPFDLPPYQPRSVALVWDDAGIRLKRVMGDALGLTPGHQRSVVRMNARGGAEVAMTLELFGSQAGTLREALSDPAQNEKIRENIVRRYWNALSIRSSTVVNENEPGLPLVFEYHGSLARIGDSTDGVLHLHPFTDAPRVLQLQGNPKRETDLLIRDESQYSEFDRKLEFDAPEGYGWTEVPEDLFLAEEFGLFAVDFNVRGRTLSCTRSCLIPVQRITPEKYAAFSKFLAAITAHHAQRIACSPIHSESVGKAHPIFSGGYATDGR